MNPALSRYLVYYPSLAIFGKGFHEVLRRFEASQWDPRESQLQQQIRRLKRRLEEAYRNVPYYRRIFDRENMSPDKVHGEEDLLRLPILTKEDLNHHFEDLQDSRNRSPRYLRSTSGSTGSPLRLYKDGESLAVMDAIMFRNYAWFGIGIGDRQARYWGAPLSGAGKTKVALKDFLLNRIRFSPFRLGDGAYGEYLESLLRFQPAYLYGYAQSIYGFADYIWRNGIDLAPLNLKAVIITGEMATEEQISRIGHSFKARVSNEYGCTEVGIIAMECTRNRMHLMIENLFVEFVKDGRHARAGEEGEIVVSELYGSAMPLIRYRIGDVGVRGDSDCDCGRGMPLMDRLKGRNDDFIVCSGGNRVDPIVFEYILKEIKPRFGKITQFRITQESRHLLSIETRYDGDDFEGITGIIRERLQEVVGREMEVVFHPADMIPAETSGKLRCFISRLED